MAVYVLGHKHLRRFARILGRPVYRAYLWHDEDHSPHALVWVSQREAAIINYKTGEVVAAPERQDHVAWLDGADPPPPVG